MYILLGTCVFNSCNICKMNYFINSVRSVVISVSLACMVIMFRYRNKSVYAIEIISCILYILLGTCVFNSLNMSHFFSYLPDGQWSVLLQSDWLCVSGCQPMWPVGFTTLHLQPGFVILFSPLAGYG